MLILFDLMIEWQKEFSGGSIARMPSSMYTETEKEFAEFFDVAAEAFSMSF